MMENAYKTIGFIGAGNMGEAIIGAAIDENVFLPESIYIYDPVPVRIEALTATYGVTALPDNITLFHRSDIVVLAVKPQQMETVLNTLVQALETIPENRKLVISIAAGTRIERIQNALYAPLPPEAQKQMPIIRVMPNTPALVGKGVSGVSANVHADESDLAATRAILDAMGASYPFPEDDLDAVTGLSGSGPGYVFYFIEAMIEAGVRAGIPRETAADMTLRTIGGALALLDGTRESPEDLRKKVSSPGGTTLAGLSVLEERHFKKIVIDAVSAAAKRSRELSG